jgi:predicted acylesterase/phospholipase RssA
VGQKNYLIKKAKSHEIRIGIALGSGGERGITHIGVQKQSKKEELNCITFQKRVLGL